MKKRSAAKMKNIFILVVWIVVLAAALLPARYINRAYGYLAFFFLLFLLLFSLLILALLRRNITVSSNIEDQQNIQCMRGTPVDLNLKIENRTPFFCSHARAGFYISDLFGNADSFTETDFTIAGRSESRFDFDMDMRHIGVYRVGLKDLQIYDMFGAFRRQVPIRGEFDVYVQPRIRSMEELVVEEEVLLESNIDTRNTVANGTDYVGVREYTPGDSMKQIHWKLSAHSLGYMTKLSESSRQSDFAVIVDFAAYEADREELMNLYDTLVETAFSVLEELSHREVTYSLIYCDRQHEVRRSIPKGRENDMEYVRRFEVITPNPKADFPDAAQMMQLEEKMPNRSTNLIVCTSRITPELIREMVSVKHQKRSPELYFIIPERLTQRERDDLTAPLRQLDEAGIAWHLTTTSAGLLAEETEGREEA